MVIKEKDKKEWNKTSYKFWRNKFKQQIQNFKPYGGIFDLEAKSKRIAELEELQQDPKTWSDRTLNEKIGKEKRGLENIVNQADDLTHQIKDNQELFELAKEEGDKETLKTIQSDTEKISKLVEDVEFKRMFSNPMDPNNCFIDFQSGSGGTEAQDWANMLLRMYIRYAEQKSFKVEVLELSDGEVATSRPQNIWVNIIYTVREYRSLAKNENNNSKFSTKVPMCWLNNAPYSIYIKQIIEQHKNVHMSSDMLQKAMKNNQNLTVSLDV